MDTIQLSFAIRLKKTNQSLNNLALKKKSISEAMSPLFVSYLAWIRTIHGIMNETDVAYQNEQIHNAFKFLCRHNLLFFLKMTRQFDVIKKLFSTPYFIVQLQHLIACINKERCKEKQIKKNRLSQFAYQQNEKLRLEKKHDVAINVHYGLDLKGTVESNTSHCRTDRRNSTTFFSLNVKSNTSNRLPKKRHASSNHYQPYQQPTFFSSIKQDTTKSATMTYKNTFQLKG